MTSGSGGHRTGEGRHRGRFAENAKPLAAILTGIAALLTAIAGMITLLRSDPAGNPASAATTVLTVQDTPAAGGGPDGAPTPSAPPSTPAPTTPDSSSPAPTPTPSPTPPPPITTPPPTRSAPPPRPTTPPPPDPQWQGAVQVGSLGDSLATVPPSPDQSGDPDISASFDGTFFASLGATQWPGPATPTPDACATLLLAQNSTHVTAVPGAVYCLRVAHSAFNPGRQYAVVQVLSQGRDATNFPYIRIQATVWPDQG
ncbi:hypothetical protein [Catenulispora pinisilvae]|uniref:hypothetical protein n=1 Tax=Catenulispora pinisilvae TaxID=2705253 RepID=UPI001891B3CE|nr:hypothetical protein [Catenulispora pinisilvae]